MPKISIEHDGKEIKVDLPTGYLEPAEAAKLQEKLKVAQQSLESIRGNMLRSQLVAGAVRAGVKREKLEPSGLPDESAPVYQASSAFKWAEDFQQWGLVDREGNFIIDANGSQSRPYAIP